MVLVLIWNDHWPLWRQPTDCPCACTVTTERKRLAEADAVVFHTPTLSLTDLCTKRPGQKWVAWSMESEVYYPWAFDPGLLRNFDYTMTYRQDSTIWVAYFGPDIAEPLRLPPKPKTEPAPAVYFGSNRHDKCGRQDYVRTLMKHLSVDSYGKSLRNRRLDGPDTGRETKLAVIARYKFTLAFENSRCLDYVTEKLFDPLIAGSVPVYRGAPNAADFAPGEHCFIDADQFAGPAELAAHLRWLDRNDAAYRRYLAWKDRPLRSQFLGHLRRLEGNPFCHLCQLVQGEARSGPAHGARTPAPDPAEA
jgi:hypothetical protein